MRSYEYDIASYNKDENLGLRSVQKGPVVFVFSGITVGPSIVGIFSGSGLTISEANEIYLKF